MTSEQWQQVKEQFAAASECGPDERSAFLAHACKGDEEVRREVESLLAAHDADSVFMNKPVGNLLVAETTMLTAGQRFGHYEGISPLAEGGMGQVYVAVDSRLGRRVALKLLPSYYTDNVDLARRFEQEARAASALNHPNIITILEIGQTDSLHFIATELVEGETLRELITNKRTTVGEVLDVAIQVASALQAAHEAGIVHRDIKPENIMLRRDRIVKVLDFGLAKLTAQEVVAPAIKSTVNTNPGVVMGTFSYMSPEQARGQEVDVRTDVWSLGVVLYEMVAGRAPFEGETPSHVIVSILESEPLPLSLDSEVPMELGRIVAKALCKEKSERYESAAEMALELKNLKEELTVESRLKQVRRLDANGKETTAKSDRDIAFGTAYAPLTRTADVGTAHPTSRAEYLVNKIKRHKGSIVFAPAVVFILIASLIYFFSSVRRVEGEAIDSVAVLPFVNEGGGPNTEYIADGISDSVIVSLSRLPSLRVISLNSVLRYKVRQTDPQAVGRELNVRAVLLGRVMQQGDALAISTELIDVRDNRRLWGKQFNCKPSEILAVQGEIARQISTGLRLRLSGEEKKRVARQYTENTDAYQLYILGRHYFHKRTKEGFDKSIEYYEQAIKADPNYALAYTGLARVYHWMGTRGFWQAKDSERKVEWATLKALELDDTLAEGHVRLGVLKFNNFDWQGAEKELKRALELDPNSPEANSAHFQYLAGIGQTDEALPYAIRAQELDPTVTSGTLALAYFLARQYDKAIETYRQEIEKKPDDALLHILLGEAFAANGMAQEGVAEMQKGLSLDPSLEKTPERWDRYPMLAYAYAVAGRRAEALKILDEQKRMAQQRYVSPYNFAIIYTGLGDKDQTFAWLAKCIEQRTRLVYRLKTRPMFDPLRSDPRYPELLRRMNLQP